MIAERPEFRVSAQDTTVVIHHLADHDLAIVTTRLTLTTRPGLKELVEKIQVVKNDDDTFSLTLNVPVDEMDKDGVWVVTVLLPPGARYAGPGAEEIESTPRSDLGRAVLRWDGRQDPALPVLWKYLRVL